jgi:LPXTG-motif cell wall-anchored protein
MRPKDIKTAVVALCGLAIATGLVTFRAQADQWDNKTTLTIDQPVQITNTLLEPGQYVLKLADSGSNRHIVQIFNGDQSRIIDTVLAIPNERLRATGDSRFMFWETPPGTARALRAWFYPGDNIGQEFRYPKQLTQLASAKTVEYAPPVAAAPAPVLTPRPEPQPVTQPVQQQAQVEVTPQPQPAPQAQEPVLLAQNNTPPPATPAPETLPHTGSSFPLIGLAGLLSLGLYSLVRFSRVS